jgi:spore coat polysaccharide biosynthesis protein SpsF
MPILDSPMLWYIFERLKKSTFITKLLVATSLNKKDGAIVDFCGQNHIECYRGSETDVLDRFYQAARVFRADIIVRFTADCPLIDPAVADKVIEEYLKNTASFDGASNVIKRTYPRGLDTEVFSMSSLEKAHKEAKDNYYREHVTAFMYGYPAVFKFISVENEQDLSDLRWTVDEEADLRFVKEVYARLYRKDKIFTVLDVLRILEQEPALIEINKNVIQKAQI